MPPPFLRCDIDDIEFLTELLSIPSFAGEEDEIGAFLVQQMRARGFDALRDKVGNAIGSIGNRSAERVVVLLGHMDTAPGWVDIRQEGDDLYGRGAVDAKGPLATFVLAAAQAAHAYTNARLIVIGAVQEEGPSVGARHLAQTMPAPSCCIIGEPSGWDCITLGYKGSYSVHYALSQDAGHGAGQVKPPAEKAVAFWSRVSEIAREYNHDKQRMFDSLDPTLRSIHTSGDGLRDRVEMSIGFRLPPGLDPAAIEEKLRACVGNATLDVTYNDPPYWGDKNTDVVRALLGGIRAAGGKPRFKFKTGTSDMNVVGPAWGCPIAAYGPGDSSLDHTPNEHIDLAEFQRGVQALTVALIALAVG